MVSKFSQHLERNHKTTTEGKALLDVQGNQKEKRQQKIDITASIRNNWNYIFNMDNPGQEILVKRRSVTGKVGNVTCKHCKGTYRRDKLAVHLTRCKQFVRVGEENKLSAIKEHSENNIASKGVSEEFQKEILHGIQRDNIIDAALNDPLILQFACDFHASRRESKSKQYVVREMRDLGRLLIKIKEIKPEIS